MPALASAPRAAAPASPSLRRPLARPQRAARRTVAMAEPTINFDRVTDRIVVGSCLKNEADAAKAKEAGVATVFSLQDETDLAANKIDSGAVAAACEAVGVRHVRRGTSDTDEAELQARLPGSVAAFAREVAAAGPVYVHCNGGRGRAPTIVTAYLFWLAGQSLEAAAATMTAGRKSSPKLPVIAGATGELLGAAGPQATLTDAERAAIKAKLDGLA